MWRWVICAAALTLASCGSTDRLRYKTIIEVETPDGFSTGSVVREISVSTPSSMPMLGEDRGSVRVKGEAVAVDLPNGKALFALLTSGDGDVDYAGRNVWFLFRELDRDSADGIIELWPNQPQTRSPRIANHLPMLVTFGDVADPKSVEKVDPANLAASFGPGVKLRRITLEMTDEPVTVAIEKRLRWLPTIYEMGVGPDFHPEGIPVGNFRGLFTMKDYK